MRSGRDAYPSVVALQSGAPLRLISGDVNSEEGSLVVLRHHDRTVNVRFVAKGWSPAELWAQEDFSDPAPGPDPEVRLPATIAICTLGVHPRLYEAVRAALTQTYEHSRVLIVDNDPSSGAARKALGDLADRVTIVDEPRRGLSHARNAAIAAVATGILAFTDDDAIVEPSWLQRLVEQFDAHAVVGAVTGLVVPAELRTPAQRTFESYVGFGKGLDLSHWTLDRDHAAELPGVPGQRGVLFPLTAGKVGSGNNMAFRIDVLRELGGFDENLGAGSITQGGEDLDIFTRVLLSGRSIIYSPDAVVWHYHRESMAELQKQVQANGIGMGALLAKAVVRQPAVALTVLGRSAAVARRALSTRGKSEEWSNDAVAPEVRRRLLASEVNGLVRGPVRYLRSRVGRR